MDGDPASKIVRVTADPKSFGKDKGTDSGIVRLAAPNAGPEPSRWKFMCNVGVRSNAMTHTLASPALRFIGFSLVELIVTLGLIGLLIGLTMPAVQKARRRIAGRLPEQPETDRVGLTWLSRCLWHATALVCRRREYESGPGRAAELDVADPSADGTR